MTLTHLMNLILWDIRINFGLSWDRIRAMLFLVELRTEQYIYQKTHHRTSIPKKALWFVLRGFGSIFQWFLCNSNIPGSTKIGKGLRLPHPQNIIISPHAAIGEFCTIYHNVSIAWNGFESMVPLSPLIGDKVLMGTGSIIIGNISIGSDVLIGAGALIVKSVPSHSRVTANPSNVSERNSSENIVLPGSSVHLKDPYSIWR